MLSGTLKDKISALSLYIRDNPKTTLVSLENLLNLVNYYYYSVYIFFNSVKIIIEKMHYKLFLH